MELVNNEEKQIVEQKEEEKAEEEKLDINQQAAQYGIPPEFLQEMLDMNKKCIRFSTWAHAMASIQRTLPNVDFLQALVEVRKTPGYDRAWTIYFEDQSRVVH